MRVERKNLREQQRLAVEARAQDCEEEQPRRSPCGRQPGGGVAGEGECGEHGTCGGAMNSPKVSLNADAAHDITRVTRLCQAHPLPSQRFIL